MTKQNALFLVKPEYFQVLFQPLGLFILLQRSCSLSYLHLQFKIGFISERKSVHTLFTIESFANKVKKRLSTYQEDHLLFLLSPTLFVFFHVFRQVRPQTQRKHHSCLKHNLHQTAVFVRRLVRKAFGGLGGALEPASSTHIETKWRIEFCLMRRRGNLKL